MWHFAESLWASPEVTDVAAQQESSTLTSIWNGVRNLFTQDEIAVELQEIITTPLLAAPPPEVLREVPRLLSANFDDALDAQDRDFLSANFGGGGMVLLQERWMRRLIFYCLSGMRSQRWKTSFNS
jgi:hypothetical protein